MKRDSRRLVIDASIAQSAGQTEHPVSRACREFLEQVLTICHHVVMTPAIREEWNEHWSRFTSKWLRSMFARRKVCVVGPHAEPRAAERLEAAGISEKGKEAIAKDLLLIEAARATGLVVASLDERARSLLKVFSRQKVGIKEVVWVNPAREEEGTAAWLEQGAPPEKERMLGYGG